MQEYRRKDEQNYQLTEKQKEKLKAEKIYYRAPGFDAGTLLWPLLMFAIYVISATIVQLGLLLADAFSTGIPLDVLVSTGNITDLLMQDFVLAAFIYSIIQVIVFALFLNWRNKKEIDYFLKSHIKGRTVLQAFVVALGLLGLSNLWMGLTSSLAETSDFWANEVEKYTSLTTSFATDNVLLLVLAVCVLVPMAEELLFRGVFLSELRRVLPGSLAVVIIALLFGLAHGNLIQGTYAALAGIGLGFMYLWSGSIYASILMHIFFNFFGTGLPIIIEKYNLLENVDMLKYQKISLIVSVVFLALAVIALINLHSDKAEDTKPKPIKDPQFKEEGFYQDI